MSKTSLRFHHGLFRILLAVPFLASGGTTDGPSRESHDREISGEDVVMIPNGAVPDAGWALARLNDGCDMGCQSFVYPETTQPVRLYLIDSGIAHLNTWFARNPKLVVDHTELIRADGDPDTSTAVTHGTRMLSLIAGKETGAALGTPVHLVSLNIFPGTEGSSTTSGRMAEAIYRAIDLHESQPDPKMPGVICLATGSEQTATSGILGPVIDEAIAVGLTVVVSAGNAGANASNFVPSAYGTKDGVICVGAIDSNNKQLSISNHGPAVDLYAPGLDVRTVSLPAPQLGTYYPMTGTSPATALTAAAAIIELSKNPLLEPAEVEAALTNGANPVVAVTAPQQAVASLVQVQTDPEGDSDNDGTSDIIENFFGSNAANPASKPAPMAIARTPGQATLSFAISADLYNGTYNLSDGSTWKIRRSENLKDWADATGTLSAGTATGGKIPMLFSLSTTSSSCFLRIEVTPAP